jgi:hypothetical protein
MLEEPNWNGLTDRQLMLLRGAIDQRMKICSGKIKTFYLKQQCFLPFYILGSENLSFALLQ